MICDVDTASHGDTIGILGDYVCGGSVAWTSRPMPPWRAHSPHSCCTCKRIESERVLSSSPVQCNPEARVVRTRSTSETVRPSWNNIRVLSRVSTIVCTCSIKFSIEWLRWYYRHACCQLHDVTRPVTFSAPRPYCADYSRITVVLQYYCSQRALFRHYYFSFKVRVHFRVH